MSDDGDRLRLHRREILGAVGAIGTVGAISGLGTAAHLRDIEQFAGSSVRAGAFDLELDCESDSCVIDETGRVNVAFTDLAPGSSGSETVIIQQTGNPAWVWLASTCPVAEVEQAIEVTLQFDMGCDGVPEYEYSGSLYEARHELASGIRLTPECLPGGEPACLSIEWAFPYQPGIAKYQGETIAVDFQVGAIQCRHTDGSIRPFPVVECAEPRRGISYVEIWTCMEEVPDCNCTRLGALEFSDAFGMGCADAGLQTDDISENHIVPGRYDLPEDDDCVDTGYDVLVTETIENEQGETVGLEFALLDGEGNPGPDLCKVVVKTGTQELVYDAEDLSPRSNSTEGMVMSGWL